MVEGHSTPNSLRGEGFIDCISHVPRGGPGTCDASTGESWKPFPPLHLPEDTRRPAGGVTVTEPNDGHGTTHDGGHYHGVRASDDGDDDDDGDNDGDGGAQTQ